MIKETTLIDDESVELKREQANHEFDQETLGNKLKKARLNLDLSVDDVATKLRLRSAVIENFENNIFTLPDLPVAFTKGYLRSYVRFLKLPDSLFQNAFSDSSKEIPNLKPMHIKPQAKPCRGFLKTLTILILLIAFGMTLLWWWQNYQQEQEKRDDLVNANSDTISLQDSRLPITQTTTLEPNKDVTDSATETTESASSATEQLENQTDSIVNSEEQPSEPENVATEAQDTALETQTNVLLQDQANVENTEVADLSETEQLPAINDQLRIEVVSAPSWITVRGNHNKTLTAKLYKAGEVLNFNDNDSYKLTIGAPVNVKVYYKGEVVPLKLDGRVARIKLP
ncbi:Cytoskeleton protein rodZ [Phocoenobacter uteri]|uniref:Cytoskeleton protein rodZ n=1 Tax=Phocoenobacter uteri TaxID=146806 RepID=A0A379CC68_9PAST|nr:RodZ domain-containing protein [Phocoenobacter uteri]MDG6881312.1 hypothetical protein [Phocoenobacter uteri]SUB59336.1 Cytoskeleton protein rodZ [Phocoenobacter uteri]